MKRGYRKKYIRILTDIIMLVSFLYLMSYHPGMGLRLHAVFGIALCVLFILHHLLNVKWYAVLLKGRYRLYRILLTVSDFLLLFAMLAIMLSSLMISGLALPVSFLPVVFYWRDIHVISTTWGFVLMAFHLGIHLHVFLFKMEKKMSATIFGYVVYLAEVLVLGAGIHGFLQSGLWNEIGMIGGMCVAVHYLIMALQKLESASLWMMKHTEN